MLNASSDVALFHAKFGAPTRSSPAFPVDERVRLRVSLISEEHDETFRAITNWDLVGVADGIADTCYVLIGTALEFGCGFDDSEIASILLPDNDAVPGFPDQFTVSACKQQIVLWMGNFVKALARRDMEETRAALYQLIANYLHLAFCFAIPIKNVWNEVQRSNMSKLEKTDHEDGCPLPASPKENPARCTCGAVIYRPDGKILKGSHYSPAAIKEILIAAGWKSADQIFDEKGVPDLGNGTMANG
jgi:hypothetical protein